jgi:hypothetical protein
LFRRCFHIDRQTTILDIGSEDGSNIHNVLSGTDHDPRNVYLADVVESFVLNGVEKYGYRGLVIDESGRLPFGDRSFDIIYCSSVIEHTTVKKDEVWAYKSGRKFRVDAFEHQRAFAREIIRCGRQYFVQTPALSFPIESHTWLPLFGYLPRRFLLPAMRITNRVWVKAAQPDFNLLTQRDLKELFPCARIEKETRFGLTKSLMAIKAGNRL